MQHLASSQKFTYHYIGFLQMLESLKKSKALELEKITLWLYVTFPFFSVLYMPFFTLIQGVF